MNKNNSNDKIHRVGEGIKYMSLLLNVTSMCRMGRKREKKMVQRIKTIDKRGVDIIEKLFVGARKE